MFYLLRFFLVVSPVPRLMLWAYAVITAAACVTVAVHPAQAREALMPILLLQAFASSTGFRASARRGYYDLLLTRSGNRIGTALVQWLASATPCAIAWFAVALVERVVGAAPVAATSGSVVAAALVTLLAWTISVPFPRFAGAIGWLLVAVMTNNLVVDSPGWDSSAADADGAAASALRVVILPALLVGYDVSAAPRVVASAVTVVAAGAVSVLLWIDRMDIPLEASQ